MSTTSGDLSGGRALSRWLQMDAISGSLVAKIIGTVNNLARSAGVSPTGQMSAPQQPNGLQIKAANGYVHAQITDNNPIDRNLHYFLEADTSSSFTQPIVVHMGPSRTSHPFPLPSNADDGSPQMWHFRCYSQYPGSLPSSHTVFGGASGPTPVSVGGGLNMTLLPSTGSGTASGTGTQGGQGFGVTSSRVAPAPKRSVGLS